MPWVKFTDDYLGDDKLKALATSSIALDMAGIIYSARELRDGRLSVKDVQVVAGYVGVKRWQGPVSALVAVGRWERVVDGFAIHGYLEYQRSREDVLAEREANRVRKAEQRAESRRTTDRNPARVRSHPYPVPDVPNGTSDPPPNPPPRRRGARNGHGLSDRDREELRQAQAQAIPLEVVS